MKSTYVKNLSFFQKKVPSIYKLLQNTELNTIDYRVEMARKRQTPVISKKVNSTFVSLHSLYDPIHEAEEMSSIFVTNTTGMIVFGFGFGYFIEAMAKRLPDISFYILEPDPQIFLHTLHHRDWTTFPWHRVTSLTVGDHPKAFHQLCMSFINYLTPDWHIHVLPGYKTVYKGAYDRFTNYLSITRKSYSINKRGTQNFEKLWTFNSLLNLHHIMNTNSIFDFKEFIKGKPILLAASGPSLEDCIPLIHRIKKEQLAYVVACGSAVNALWKHGIRPDFYITYDPGPLNYDGPAGLQYVIKENIPLVFGSTVHYQIVKECTSPKAHFIMDKDNITTTFIKCDKRELVVDATSVSIISLSLLYKMECGPIYIAGQDFALKGNKFYADGNKGGFGVGDNEIVEADIMKKIYYPVKSTIGGEALTNDILTSMREGLEVLIKKHPDVKIYNLSSFGAHIQGTEYISISQAEDKFNSLLEKVMPIPFTAEVGAPKDNLNKIYAKLKNQLKEVQIEAQNLKSELLVSSTQPKVLKKFLQLNQNESISKFVYPMMHATTDRFLRLFHNTPPNQKQDFMIKELPLLLDEIDALSHRYLILIDSLLEERGALK